MVLKNNSKVLVRCATFNFFKCKRAHGNRFVTSEAKLLYLKSPGVKFMNHFTDLKNPLLKSF